MWLHGLLSQRLEELDSNPRCREFESHIGYGGNSVMTTMVRSSTEPAARSVIPDGDGVRLESVSTGENRLWFNSTALRTVNTVQGRGTRTSWGINEVTRMSLWSNLVKALLSESRDFVGSSPT
jgi:hypothetical protein